MIPHSATRPEWGIVLVCTSVARHHDTPFGTGRRRPLADDLGRESDRIAGIDRLEPSQVAEARRNTKRRDRLSPRAHVPPQARTIFDDVPHPETGGVPAGCAEAAERRTRSRCFVEMEGLRVETDGKRFDLLGGEGVAPDFGAFANIQIFEKLHAGA